MMLTRARYDNVAESKDELSFNQGDIVSVIRTDTGSDSWWLCQSAGNIGLVPVSYLESVNAVPEIFQTSFEPDANHIYDQIPANQGLNRDGPSKRYSDPERPAEVSLRPHQPLHVSASMQNIRVVESTNGIYDVPKAFQQSEMLRASLAYSSEGSRSRSSTPAPSIGRENIYDQLPRPRNAGDVQDPLYDSPRNSTSVYRVPSSSMSTIGLYDVPKSNMPLRTSDDGYFSPKRESVLPLSVEVMTEVDACKKLQNLNEEINRTWEELVESVYNARWDGGFKDLTVARTIAATQAFDAHLNAFLDFIKGIINVLTQLKEDNNPRLKFSNQFGKLHESRVDFLDKLGYIQDGSGDVQGAAQSLIALGLGMLQGIKELDILVRAFRSIVFKQSSEPSYRSGGDYCSSTLDVRQMRRKPTDALPPTPTINMGDSEMVQNLQTVKSFSRILSVQRPPRSTGSMEPFEKEDNRLKHHSTRSWNSQENLLASSPPLGVLYVSPPQGLNPYDPHRSSGSGSVSPTSDEETTQLSDRDRQCMETYTREFVSSLPLLIRGVQKLRVCIEEAKSQALQRAHNGRNESAKEKLVGCSGEIVKVGHGIVIQGDCVFKKIQSVHAKQAVLAASGSVSLALKSLGESSKSAVLQYPNLAAIDKVATAVETVRVSTLALGRLLKELPTKN
nr:breast cancer anti-estrogen resistance 1 [Halisarca dujardinii]